MTNIYVGNLAFTASEQSLHEAFSRYGTVTKVSIAKDRETGRPRGFGFVEMANNSQAATAIKELNLSDIEGRSITVNEARPREDRPRRNNGGGRRW